MNVCSGGGIMTSSSNSACRAGSGCCAIRAMLRTLAAWPALLILLFGARPALHAQLDTGSISGVVTDSAGSVVQGVAVTARESSTGTQYSTVSSSTGYYVFPSLHTGTYTISAVASGFKTAVYSGIVVMVGSHTGQNITLAVGAVNESVSVNAQALTLETETSEVDASVTPA